jgi:hypothetical protein
LESLIAGVAFSVFGRLAVAVLSLLPGVSNLWVAIAPKEVPFLGTACGAFLLGISSPYVVNQICSRVSRLPKFNQTEAQFRAISRHGNHILRLVHTAVREERPISLTLDNRKLYVGVIVDAPNLEAHDAFLSLMPWFSGYRDKDTLVLVFTVDYLRVYEKQNLEKYHFRVVVPISSIRMISFFDPAVLSGFRSGRRGSRGTPRNRERLGGNGSISVTQKWSKHVESLRATEPKHFAILVLFPSGRIEL